VTRLPKLVISAAALGTAAVLTLPAASRFATASGGPPPGPATATPVQHLVVIFQENVSFDHYFGTYPNAANTSGQEFRASNGTPAVNGLTSALLNNNPNKDSMGNTANPQRLDPANINDVLTCDQNHNYTDEQTAFDNGAMDKFVTTLGTGSGKSPTGQACSASDVMKYYDGNTVTALWNYAQRFSMSDNSFGTTFGPSSPGAINLVSGDTGGVDITGCTGLTANPPTTAGCANMASKINPAGNLNNTSSISIGTANADVTPDGLGGLSLTSDAQPFYDDCSTRDAVALTGKNVGDQLNQAGLSWGWFQGGFRPTTTFAAATGGKQNTNVFTPNQFKNSGFATPPASNQGLCNAYHAVGAAVGGTGAGAAPGNYGVKDDYIPHHEPFQYYASTANPHHLAPTSLAAIGTDSQTYTANVPNFDTANHQYDTSDFDALVGAISHGYLTPDHLPAVSFLKAPGYEDGHGAYSDPYDEQVFVTREINAPEHTPDWSTTAVVVSYDDSDGWYDHVYSGIHNTSQSVADNLTAPGMCGNQPPAPLAGEEGRCGYGPRLPLLVISPWARQNFVDHTLTDQSSVTRFIEDNWLGGARITGSFATIAGTLNNLFNFNAHHGTNQRLFLDETTGQPFDS
jgi:phospholipase C